ncbi:MAG TPA: PilZ domain-containing protein [Rhodanobacteraceae bacterium]|nr:PilZ domain-containing protein [Rhodanobacteraceae bacterium]
MNDERRTAPRKPSNAPIEVINSISGENIGRIGNLSRNGLMLICHRPLNDDALYQLRFRLPDLRGTQSEIETGVHTMWTEQAATNGYQWSGLRIISISATAAKSLDRWLEQGKA